MAPAALNRYFHPSDEPGEEAMGKRIAATVSRAGARRSAVALVLLACLIIAGCAQRDRSDDENRSGGFYGGVFGGR